MQNPIGFGLVALAATASMAYAGGDDDKKKEKTTLERLGTPSLQGTGSNVQVTAAPGKGITFTAGDDFSLRLSNRIQVQWTFADNEQDVAADTQSFSIRRARTSLDGHIYEKDFTYKLQLEWATAAANVLDAWFRWRFWGDENGDLALRFGAQKPMFGREATGTSSKLEFIDRSIVAGTFSNNRVIGAILQGSLAEKRVFWNAGVINSDPAGQANGGGTFTIGGTSSVVAIAEEGTNVQNADNEVDFVASVRFDPFGDMGDEGYEQGDLRTGDDRNELLVSVGGGVVVGNHRGTHIGTGLTSDVETINININGGAKYMGWHSLAEVFIRTDEADFGVAGAPDDQDSTGFQVSLSYTLPPQPEHDSRWGFGGRFSYVNADETSLVGGGDASQNLAIMPVGLGGSSGSIQEIEGMVTNYYHRHNLKTHIGYRFQTVDEDGSANDEHNHIIAVLFQFMF